MCATRFIRFPKSDVPQERFNVDSIVKWYPYFGIDNFHIRIKSTNESFVVCFEKKRDLEYAIEMLDKETTKIG